MSNDHFISSSFQCWFCERNLLNKQYLIHKDFACCLICFEEKFSPYCHQCKQIITIDMQGKYFQEKFWHKNCFNCSICGLSLINQRFAYENDMLFCRNCLINQFAERCYRCNRSIEPSEKCLRYEKKFYHQSCFVCNVCQRSLINHDFQRRENEYLLCLVCHQSLIAIYCIKCHQAITNDGVLYQNHPFHQECFLCTYCNHSLRTERYVEYNQQAYCLICANKLFR